MYLSIPYNGDLELLTISEAKKYPVKTVYGKRLQDVIGGGRARYDIANYNDENLKQAIEITHRMGAQFNYLFNAPCSANAEKTKELEILKQVEDLIENFGIRKEKSKTIYNSIHIDAIREDFKSEKRE